MRVLEDMKELLEDQLKKIYKKGDAITPQELDNAYKAVDIIKDIATIEAMERAEKEQDEMMQSSARGYSMHYPMMPDEYEAAYARGGNTNANAYARGGQGGSRDGGQSNAGGQGGSNMGPIYDYSEDYSTRRGRGQNGRYISRDGGGSSSESYAYLEEAMRSAATEQERDAIRQAMNANKMYR
jgi:hypothetical protein